MLVGLRVAMLVGFRVIMLVRVAMLVHKPTNSFLQAPSLFNLVFLLPPWP